MFYTHINETWNYEGVNFEKNYILSNLLRSFVKDSFALEEYTKVFGEETKNFFSYLIERKEIMNEVSQISGLLFENCIEKKLKEHLIEMKDDDLLKLCEQDGFLQKATTKFGFDSTKISNFFSKAKEGILTTLKNVWEKFSSLGVIENIKNLLSSGFSWVKDLISKGLEFFTNAGIGELVIPAMLVFRGVAPAIAGINAIRRKKKMKPLTKEEKEEFEEKAKKNKTKIDKQIKKIS